MPALNIQTIKPLCKDGGKQIGSIKKLELTDTDNIGFDFGVKEGSEVFVINFRRYSGRYQVTGKQSRAGGYDEQECSVYVPRMRASMELLRRNLRDRKITAIITDANDDKYIIDKGHVMVNFDTGAALADSAGYELTITGKDLGRGYLFFYDDTYEIIGEEGTTSGSDDFTPGEVPGPVPGESSTDSCCVVIVTTPISEAPPATGNTENKNRILTTVSGDRYFIDKFGNSLLLNAGFNRLQKFTTIGAHIFTITAFSLPETTEVNLIVIRGNILMRLVLSSPIYSTDYTIDGDNIVLSEDFPLEEGELLRVYKINANPNEG